MDGAGRVAERLRETGWRRPRPPLWAGIAAAVAVFAALALMVGPGDIRAPSLPAELSRQPDLYLEDATITQFRPDGTLHYRMHVAEATYFDEGGRAEVAAPVTEFFAGPSSPWRIESARGEVRNVATPSGAVEERADLAGDVVLSRTAQGTSVELRTQALTVYPSRELVRGDQPVMIRRDSGGRTTAAGFEADLASGRIRLFSDADERVSIVVKPTEFE